MSRQEPRAGCRLPSPPTDPGLLFGVGMKVAALTAVVAMVVGLVSTAVGAPRPFQLAANDFWAFGALSLLAWEGALVVTVWSKRLPLPPPLHVLGTGGLLLAAAVSLSLGGVLDVAWIKGLGWVLEAVGGFLVLLILWQGEGGGREQLDDLLAPGFRLPGEEKGDRLARTMASLAFVDLVLFALFSLRHGHDFSAPSIASLLFWYGWIGSACLATMHFFMPRFLGQHPAHPRLSTLGFAAWQAGLLGAFAFRVWWLLALTVVGGIAILLNLISLVRGILRPRPRVVGSRRMYIQLPLRLLLASGLVVFFLAVAAIPWVGPIVDGGGRLVATWVLAAFFVLFVHAAAVHLGWRFAPGALAASVGVWMLGWILSLWHGEALLLSGILTSAGALLTFAALGRWSPHRSQVEMFKGHTGA